MTKDQAARPAKGQMFPMAFPQLLREVLNRSLRTREGDRLPIVLRNPLPSDKKEDLVAEFLPGRALFLVSVRAEMPNPEALSLWTGILNSCQTLADRRVAPNTGKGPVYAFLGPSVPLRVVERWYHYQTRKYRGTDKFTGGLNRKLIKLEERPVNLGANHGARGV